MSSPKKTPDPGSFISTRWLAPLRELAAFVVPSRKGWAPLALEVAGVLEAAEGSPYPSVPRLAAERFNQLAEAAPLQLHAGPPAPDVSSRGALLIKPVAEVDVGLQVDITRGVHGHGVWAFRLAYGYFMNPERDRLRRCAVAGCRRWFVDATKNRSARRCSRACTITWSNSQRGTRR